MLNKFFIIPKWLFPALLAFQPVFCSAQQYDAELIQQHTTVEATKDKLVEINTYEIRINNRDGDRYAEVTIPFNKMHKVFAIEATIFDYMGNKVRELKKTDITERSAFSDMSFFTDSYVKEFTLRNNTYPYTLRYSYRTESSQFLSLTYWYPVLDYDIPARSATLQLIIPQNYPVNYKSNLVSKPKIDSIGGSISYLWETSFTTTFSSEIYSPPMTQFEPYVEVIPQNFMYVNEGSHDSWKSFGEWNLGLLKGLDDLPLTEKIKITSLTDTIQDPKEKIRILFHYLQDATRYINVSIKTGGMKPYPASYVAEKKYGDCKALANYFKTCLSVIGIKAYYTAINAGDKIEPIDTAFPSQQFNHVILFIPLKADTLWADCTSDLAFGYLGTFTQNRPALVMNENSSALVTTSKLTFDNVLENRKIKATINASGELKANFRGTYRGDKYELLFSLKSYANETQRRQYIDNYITEDNCQTESYTISNSVRDTPQITLEYNASSDQMLKEYGEESLLKIIPLKFPYMEEPKKRKLPIQINYPEYRSDTLEFTIPPPYKITTLPPDVTTHSKYGDYQVRFVQNGNIVMAIKQMKINAGQYQLSEYLDFYSFIIALRESENSFYITLKKT